jgi:membrane-associated phospholipid phosphatase
MPSSREIRYYLLCLALILPFLFFDQYVMVWLKELRSANPDLDQLFHQAGMIAYFAAHGALIAGAAVLIYLAGIRLKKPRTRQLGKALFIGFVSSGISVQVIKHLLGRARPRITDELLFIGPTFRGSYDSFPSGHTITAFCLAYICSAFFPKYRPLFYAYGAFICIGRVLGGSHFPADVLAGALLGIVIARMIEKKSGLPGPSTPETRTTNA